MSEFKEEDVIFVEFEGENPQHGIQVNDKEFVFVGSRDCSRYVEGLILGTLNTVKTSSGGSYQVYDLNDDERLNLQADLAKMRVAEKAAQRRLIAAVFSGRL